MQVSDNLYVLLKLQKKFRYFDKQEYTSTHFVFKIRKNMFPYRMILTIRKTIVYITQETSKTIIVHKKHLHCLQVALLNLLDLIE